MKSKKCCSRTAALLEVPSKGTQHVHVTVRLSEPPTTSIWYQLKAAGLNITSSSGEILVGIVEVKKLSQLLAISDVRWIESGRPMAFEDFLSDEKNKPRRSSEFVPSKPEADTKPEPKKRNDEWHQVPADDD